MHRVYGRELWSCGRRSRTPRLTSPVLSLSMSMASMVGCWFAVNDFVKSGVDAEAHKGCV